VLCTFKNYTRIHHRPYMYHHEAFVSSLLFHVQYGLWNILWWLQNGQLNHHIMIKLMVCGLRVFCIADVDFGHRFRPFKRLSEVNWNNWTYTAVVAQKNLSKVWNVQRDINGIFPHHKCWCDCSGNAMGLQLDCNVIAMVLQWDCNGIAMGMQWDCNGIESWWDFNEKQLWWV